MPYPPKIFIHNDTDDGDNFDSLLVDTSERKSKDIYADYLKSQANLSQATAAIGSNQQPTDHTGKVIYGMAILTVGVLLARSFCRGKIFKKAATDKDPGVCPERQLMISQPRS